MRILFVGDLNKYGRSFQRYRTLRALGHDITGVSMFPVSSEAGVKQSSISVRLAWKLGFPLDETGANETIKKAVEKDKFDVVWIEKGNTIHPATLRHVRRKLPAASLVSCSEDDMYAWHNRSFYYTLGLKYYDVVFTTKTYNLEKLKRLGAHRTELFLDAHDETLHHPMELSADDRRKYGCDVGFIGTFEKERALSILYLAQHGIRVVIWGNGWGRWMDKHPNVVVKNTPIYGEEYVKAINATKINLCFLRKMNRDETTSRSVEIPACSGFMLAERTKRHLEFFKDGKEAVFFSSPNELLVLARHYLADAVACAHIGTAGRARCLASGYDMQTQLSSIIARSGGL